MENACGQDQVTDPSYVPIIIDSSWDPREDYHIYAVDNSEKEIIWYIDGKEVARRPNLYMALAHARHAVIRTSLSVRWLLRLANGSRCQKRQPAMGFRLTSRLTTSEVWQKKSAKTSPNDWTREEYLVKEKAN